MFRYFRVAWEGLKDWLRHEPQNFQESCVLMVNCWFAVSAWSLVALCILHLSGVIAKINLAMTPIDIFAFAFIEEIGFRLLFIGPFIYFWEKRNIGLLLIVSVVSSVIFGLAHGHLYNLLIQGVGGFIICLFFIKACNINWTQDRIFQYRAVLITSFAHFLHNAISARMIG